jgi:DNA-binding ferritin-like protein
LKIKNKYSKIFKIENKNIMYLYKMANRTLKRGKSYRGVSKYSENEIVLKFIQMLNIIKIYHWKTLSYPQHKATDELYESFNGRMDEFVETMLGKTGKRVNLSSTKSIPFYDYTNVTKFKQCIEMFKAYLVNMSNAPYFKNPENSDLLNIRDEILGDLNKFTYLLTFH